MEQYKKIYETTVIINPTLEEHQIEGIIKSIEEMIIKNGGTIKSVEKWGRKRLSYPISKRNNGYFAHFEFESDGSLVSDLERSYQYDENIMRYLTIKLDKRALKAKEQSIVKPKSAVDEEIEIPEVLDIEDDLDINDEIEEGK